MNTKRLLTVVFVGVFAEIVNKLTPILLIRFGEERLGLAGLGIAQYSIYLAEIFITFVMLGIPQRGLIRVAELFETNDVKGAGRLISSHYVLKATQLLLVAIGFFVFIGSKPEYSEYLPVLLLLSPAIFFSVFDTSYFFFARQKLAQLAGISILIRLVSLAMVLAFVTDQDDIALYAFLTFGMNAIASIYTFSKVARSVPFQWPGWAMVWDEFKNCLPHGVYLFFFTLAFRFDALIVESLFSKEELGQYMGISKIHLSLIPIIAYLSSAFFSEQLAMTDKEQEKKLVRYSLNMVLIPVGLLASCIWTIDHQLLEIVVGSSFSPLAKIFSVFVSSLLFLAILFILSAQVFLRHQNLWILNSLWGFLALTGTLLSWGLSNIWSLDGVVFGTFISRAVFALIAVLLAEKYLTGFPIRRDLVANLSLCFLMSGVAIWLEPIIGLWSLPFVALLHLGGIFLIQRIYLIELWNHFYGKIAARLGNQS